MLDLPQLRADLRNKIQTLDDINVDIPETLKEPLPKIWERCASTSEGQIQLWTNLGKNTQVMGDPDLIKSLFAADLTRELLAYRKELQVHLDVCGITSDQARHLNTSVNPDQPPGWWGPVKASINSADHLGDENKARLVKFALENTWSGCTKGVGRNNDFFQSAVVNALKGNVTHNSILAVAAKDLIELPNQEIPEKIRRWYLNFLTGFSGNSTEAVRLVISNAFHETANYLGKSLVQSTLAKPFAILTGASGTGKTKLAESLAVHLTNSDQNNSAVIAVGADWTDNRNVLGFVNHLRTDDSGTPTYQTTPVLDLLLRADGDPDTPYFLILDEMNLSHVERYFSDFLSVMEQKDGQFDLHSEGPASDQDFRLPVSEGSKTGVPQKLDYPQNLFVIGTVNIDETTYMFSPKVLDRANVIEFKVGRDDLGAFLEKPGSYPETQPAASGVAEGFLELAKKTRAHLLDPLPDSVRDSVSTHLLTLFDLLRNERFEFAYRTAKEITLFLQVSRELAKEPEPWDNEGWQEDLDTQILQKILPKLHGSIGRIAPLITALSHYCESGKTSGAPSLRDLVNSPFNEEEKAKALFSRSAEKLREMAKTLSSEQFVSFIS